MRQLVVVRALPCVAALALAGCYDYGDASGEGVADVTGSYDGFDLAAIDHAYAKTCSTDHVGGIAITLTTNDCRNLGSPGSDDVYLVAVVFAGSAGASTAPKGPGTFTLAGSDVELSAFGAASCPAGGCADPALATVTLVLEDIEADDITGTLGVTTADAATGFDAMFTTSSCTTAAANAFDGCTE